MIRHNIDTFMKRFQLDIEEMTGEFFYNARLLGIVASITDYRLCWSVNQLFRFKFRLNNDIEIQLTKRHRKYYFPIYEYCEPQSSMKHYIYNNQHDGEFLLPEFRNLDFLWLLKGDPADDEEISAMITSLKKISFVQLVVELTNEKILNKEHLIL